jgi:hypothetical protein
MNPPVLPQRLIDLMSPADRAKLGKAGRTTLEIFREVEEQSERDLHRDIVRYLNVLGVPFAHARMDKKSSIAVGYPDFSFPYRGRFVAWEAKVRGRPLDADQQRTREMIEKHGGQFAVIRGLEDAKNHLREIDSIVEPKPTI